MSEKATIKLQPESKPKTQLKEIQNWHNMHYPIPLKVSKDEQGTYKVYYER
jgi:hypothetical protein